MAEAPDRGAKRRRLVPVALAIAACAVAPPHDRARAESTEVRAETIAASPLRPSPAHLVVPDVVDLPYVVAGEGGTSATFSVTNDGGSPLEGQGSRPLAWRLDGDATLSIASAPASIAPGERANVTVAFAGAAQETIARATLALATPSGELTVPVYAVAGDPKLGEASFEPMTGAGGVIIGEGVTVGMPAAPFPSGGAPWRDDSVHVFVPRHYRDRGAQDVIVHFHGFSSTIEGTLASHDYREHVYASGSNAVLVVPQGPENARSGDFGKLTAPGGLSRLVDEVLALLYREGRVAAPVLGQLVLSSHSGGYDAVARQLGVEARAPRPAEVMLFDSLYGDVPEYLAYAKSGGLFRSDYTEGAGTKANNLSLVGALGDAGVRVATTASPETLSERAPVVFFAPTTHEGATRHRGAYGEALRWGLGHSRRGPRVDLLSVVPEDGSARLSWRSPRDEDLEGFRVETSRDGATWEPAAKVGKDSGEATIALPRGARVRVVPITTGVEAAEALPSDVYRVDPGAKTLVVDGFDRVIDGSFGGLSHDFAARVGEAAGPVATASHRALAEGDVPLDRFTSILWLLGDQGRADGTLDDDERALLSDYVGAGGSLVVSGSEVAFDLAGGVDGAVFLDTTFGASFVDDDAHSHLVIGQGPLAALGALGFGGPSAPYAEDYPDALTTTSGGDAVLRYDNGHAAAVGIAGKAVLVGFPLELVDDAAKREALVQALLAFAGG
jgi:hypothetical protein